MGSMWRRAIEYLGLAPDDEYDDAEPFEEVVERPANQSRSAARSNHVARQAAAAPADADRGPVVRALPVNPRPSPEADDDPTGDRVTPRPMVVRPTEQPVMARPQVVSPSSFAAAQEVADRFKANRPVIMNLQGLDRDLSRRLIDFASGLCYGLGGQMDRVASHVFLLTPADVTVPEEERRRLTERGLHDA